MSTFVSSSSSSSSSKRRCCSCNVHHRFVIVMMMTASIMTLWLGVLYADAAAAAAAATSGNEFIITNHQEDSEVAQQQRPSDDEFFIVYGVDADVDSNHHHDDHDDSGSEAAATTASTAVTKTDIVDDNNNVETIVMPSGTVEDDGEEDEEEVNYYNNDDGSITSAIYHVPVYTKQDLLQLFSSSSSSSSSSTTTSNTKVHNDLLRSLSTIGLIAIQVDDNDNELYENARTIGLSSFMNCIAGKKTTNTNDDETDEQSSSSLFHTVIGSKDHGGLLVSGGKKQNTQGQQMISRSTLATAMIGDIPLSLPTQKEFQMECNNDNKYDNVMEHMESLRDIVTDISNVFIQTLDSIIEDNNSGERGCSNHCCHNEQQEPLMKSITGEIYPTIRSIIKSSTHLEHFHVYHSHNNQDNNNTTNTHYEQEESQPTTPRQQQQTRTTTSSSSNTDTTTKNNNNMILDVHTDAGLFLSFVPGLRCRNKEINEMNSQSSSTFICSDDDENSDLYIMNGSGVLHKAIFPTNTIGIMVGIGLQNWLHLNDNNIKLTATKHAVHMPSGYTRGWYGRMYLVPPQAIIQDYPAPRTFADMRQAMVVTNHNVRTRQYSDLLVDDNDNETNTESYMSIGCGSNEQYHQQDAKMMFDNNNTNNNMNEALTLKERRRLTMVPDASACNNSTNFYCWMSCLDIPDATHSGQHINDGQSLYCADPKTLVIDNNIKTATKPCNDYTSDGVVIGGAMNTNCIGIWQPTASGIPATPVIPSNTTTNNNGTSDENESTVEDSFCRGGTSMYMDGFHWLHPVCVIYLFPSWILSTSGKLIGASFGTIFFGIALEGVIHQRRYNISNMSIGWTRLSLSTIIYGLQLTMGYMIMLVVMTYSGPLFLSVILGLMGGHFIFNSYDVYEEKKLSQLKKNDDDNEDDIKDNNINNNNNDYNTSNDQSEGGDNQSKLECCLTFNNTNSIPTNEESSSSSSTTNTKSDGEILLANITTSVHSSTTGGGSGGGGTRRRTSTIPNTTANIITTNNSIGQQPNHMTSNDIESNNNNNNRLTPALVAISSNNSLSPSSISRQQQPKYTNINNNNIKASSRKMVPEGCTPCCQNAI